jgi:hypothetical protein
MKFSQKSTLRIADFEKLCFFESAIFLLHFNENQSKVLGYQEWVEILMITLVSSQKSLNPNISAVSVQKVYKTCFFANYLFFK